MHSGYVGVAVCRGFSDLAKDGGCLPIRDILGAANIQKQSNKSNAA